LPYLSAYFTNIVISWYGTLHTFFNDDIKSQTRLLFILHNQLLFTDEVLHPAYSVHGNKPSLMVT